MPAHPTKLGWAVSWTCSLSSLALLLLTLGLALHVRVGLGHWPRPMWEDYQTLGFQTHQLALLGVGLFAVYAAVPVWILCVSFRRLRASPRVLLVQAGIYLAGWALVAGLIRLDPYQFVTWLVD
jgi:hypothetical protein